MLTSKTVNVIGAPIRDGQPKSGPEEGPKALRNAQLKELLQQDGWTVCDLGDVQTISVADDPPEGRMKNPRSVGASNQMVCLDFLAVLIASAL